MHKKIYYSIPMHNYLARRICLNFTFLALSVNGYEINGRNNCKCLHIGISIISIYSLNVENQYCKFYSLIINLHIFLTRTLYLILLCFVFGAISKQFNPPSLGKEHVYFFLFLDEQNTGLYTEYLFWLVKTMNIYL